MKDIKAKIISNIKICANHYKMALDAPAIAPSAKPGQFVQVRCSDTLDPFLRRPFSVHRVGSREFGVRSIEILYEVVGRGTEILSKKEPGDFIDVLGPLGNGFSLLQTPNSELKTILVAGGIGVAPLVFLAEALVKRKIKIVVLIGARTKKLILCEKDFKNLGAEVHIATDDGTRGYKGLISKLFEKLLRTTNNELRTTIYACGPQPMLQCIAEICEEKNIECQVSLEERIACGIGACLGCAVKVKGKVYYKLACKDGPVFNASELNLTN